MEHNIMQYKTNPAQLLSSSFGVLVAVLGCMNLFLVHPVPGIMYLILSLIYFPVTDAVVQRTFDVPVPAVVKIIFGIVILWFTLGVSDLGDMIEKL